MKEFLDEKYYTDFIKSKTDLKLKTQQKLENKLIPESRLSSVKINQFKKDFHILIAMFSRGDSKDILKEFLTIILDDINEVWVEEKVRMQNEKTLKLMNLYYIEYYIYMRWLLSLAILLEISDTKFQILVNLIDRDDIKDILYDFMIVSKNGDRIISDTLSVKEPKNRIQEIIFFKDNSETEKSLKKYLNIEWFKTYKFFSFFDSHKKANKDYVFFGYWAFEVAAIVKIKGLDDSSFRDNKYYPNRLV